MSSKPEYFSATEVAISQRQTALDYAIFIVQLMPLFHHLAGGQENGVWLEWLCRDYE